MPRGQPNGIAYTTSVQRASCFRGGRAIRVSFRRATSFSGRFAYIVYSTCMQGSCGTSTMSFDACVMSIRFDMRTASIRPRTLSTKSHTSSTRVVSSTDLRTA